ncbi:MAG: transcriptional regulator with PAS, ATPase and Fis domain [Arenicella sp.]|jgi:transcriptional regulator with PAS, ATPase and Fis domain
MNEIDRLTQMLQAYEVPAILVSSDYEILASNRVYAEKFGEVEFADRPKCFAVSHGYNKPCDQSGEDCPLLAAKISHRKEKVLHIHQTPNGREHVDVEMIPIFDADNNLSYFVELLRPVPLASGTSSMQKMIGASPAFEEMLRKASLVAKTDANVLLLGESGTGKELASQSIHLASKRSDKLMVALECAGLSDALIESELFGHIKGSFTGANANKIGLVEQADGGTLFLDEIGDVPIETQVKLLRLIESKTFRRVGSTEVRTSNFRLICATNKDLRKLVDSGEFRHDLYYRINVFPIHTPSLRARRGDIALLANHFIKTVETESDLHITQSAITLLEQQEFRGNIRELFNILNRAIILAQSNVIDERLIRECFEIDLNDGNLINSNEGMQNITPPLSQLESNYFADLLKKHNGDKALTASAAGISLRTLYRKLDIKR